MRLTNDRIAVQARAARYLAQKQFEKDQKQQRNDDRLMTLLCGIVTCVIVHFLGAL